MKLEKIHAADYTASEVEAAKRVMIEVAQNLGEYADACVVVGGCLIPPPGRRRWRGRVHIPPASLAGVAPLRPHYFSRTSHSRP